MAPSNTNSNKQVNNQKVVVQLNWGKKLPATGKKTKNGNRVPRVTDAQPGFDMSYARDYPQQTTLPGSGYSPVPKYFSQPYSQPTKFSTDPLNSLRAIHDDPGYISDSLSNRSSKKKSKIKSK